jgi:PTS system nitrogen regulatory IIA component
MRIAGLLQPEDIFPDLVAGTKEEVLAELAAGVVGHHPGLDRDKVIGILLERERLGSTGIGDGIAIPHGKLGKLDQPILAVGRSLRGVDFNALDGRPVKLFFLLLAPEEAVGFHLKLLARISRILKDPVVRTRLLEAPGVAAMNAVIQEQDSRQ